MNPPWVYTCSQSWTPHPPPSPYHPSGSSQCTSPKHPVSRIKPGQAIHFFYDIIHVSNEVDETGAYYTEWSKPERKTPIQYTRRQWHPTPVLLPRKSHGQRSLVGCSPWGHEELYTTEWLHFHFSLSCIGEGNGNPLQCSCLEKSMDRAAWQATVHGTAKSRTRLSNFQLKK